MLERTAAGEPGGPSPTLLAFILSKDDADAIVAGLKLLSQLIVESRAKPPLGIDHEPVRRYIGGAL